MASAMESRHPPQSAIREVVADPIAPERAVGQCFGARLVRVKNPERLPGPQPEHQADTKQTPHRCAAVADAVQDTLWLHAGRALRRLWTRACREAWRADKRPSELLETASGGPGTRRSAQ